MPMPETETIELRTDTIEQLIDLLEADLQNVEPLMTEERRNCTAARLQRSLES